MQTGGMEITTINRKCNLVVIEYFLLCLHILEFIFRVEQFYRCLFHVLPHFIATCKDNPSFLHRRRYIFGIF